MGLLPKGRGREPESSRNSLTRAIIVGFVAVVVLEGWIAWALRTRAPEAGRLPEPNGYDELVQAAMELRGAAPAKPPQIARTADADDGPPPTGPADLPSQELDRLEVRSYLDANRNALERARRALGSDSRVPVQFVHGYARKSKGTRDAVGRLATLFLWEAWLAESEARHEDASRADLDLIRMGVAASRGGLQADALFGDDLINGGLAGLRRRLHRLEIGPCARAVQALTAIEEKREPRARVIDRQKEYDRAEGWPIAVAIVQLTSSKARKEDREDASRYEEVVANLRLTQIELALRIFRIRKGSDPNTLTELVPHALRILPFDPFNREPFRYTRTKTGHTLYSIGPDNHDDSGAPLQRSSFPPTGDLNPESLSSSYEPITAR